MATPETIARTEAAPSRQLLPLALLLVAAGLIFRPTLASLWQTWMSDPNSSHGLLVPAISAWLVWNRRGELTAAGKPALGGLALLLSGLLLYALGTAGFVRVLAALGVVASLSGLAWFNLGQGNFKRLAFAFAFLLFAIPLPVGLTSLAAFPLQLFASRLSAALLGLCGVSVLREGNMLYFANTQLEVAEACSGLRSMTAFLMLGALFAHLLKGGWAGRLFLLALAIPLAVVMNIVRVTGTGLLANRYGDEVAKGFLHEFSGLVVFAAGFVVMVAVYLWLERRANRAR